MLHLSVKKGVMGHERMLQEPKQCRISGRFPSNDDDACKKGREHNAITRD
jgi:hypothetical protein